MADERAIFHRYPGLTQLLPFVALGDLPTPVHRVTDLENALGIERLWIKRDDISAKIYGGNKIRKLEFLLATARQNGCDTVITFGGFGSNHALATAIFCRELGLRCVAILTPEPATDAVRQTLRYHLALGTRIEVAHDYGDVRATARRVIDELGDTRCYEVPFGGSSWVGATGFVNAGLELARQISNGVLDQPDVIYIGCGTAGSVAGLALGLGLAKLPIAIEAVQVTPESMHPERLYRQLFADTNRELHARDSAVTLLGSDDAAVNVRTDQLGEGYAMPTAAGREAAGVLERTTKLPASLTYTAKTMAALMADAGRGSLAGKNVLFWNTYNSNAYPEFAEDDSWRKLPVELHAMFTTDGD